MTPVAVYLAAIVVANIAAATWGPAVTIPNALLLVGLDLTLRDAMHVAWAGQGWLENRPWLLPMRMGLLIAAAGALSYLATPGAGQIAVASAVAWGAASITDALVFHYLWRRLRTSRAVIGSNVASAAVDSLVFPTLAFGGPMLLVSLGQFVAKVVGGALWMVVLRALSQRRAAA